jgi:hypothetical protein
MLGSDPGAEDKFQDKEQVKDEDMMTKQNTQVMGQSHQKKKVKVKVEVIGKVYFKVKNRSQKSQNQIQKSSST